MVKTQAEKSAVMRERLMQAAIDCLVELGYARTTTTEIVKRAKVSRGAMLHHFPSKNDLIVGTIEFVAEQRLGEFREAVQKLPQGDDRLPQAIDLVWTHFSSPTFYALLELSVAARTEPELLSKLRIAADRFEVLLSKTTRDLFGEQVNDVTLLNLGQTFLYYVMQGMATTNMIRDESNNIAGVMALIKQLVKSTLPK